MPGDDKSPHWGPNTTNSFPVKGAIGLIITIGVIAIVLIGVPQARLWIYVSIPLGILIGVILHFVRK